MRLHKNIFYFFHLRNSRVFFRLNFIVAFSLILSFGACKSKKKSKTTTPEITTQIVIDSSYEKCKMDFKNGKSISRLMKEKELDFNTISGRFTCKMGNEEEDENTFQVSVRCRKDSAIWMNISKLNVDAVRFLMTKDSVKFMIMTSLGGLEKGFFRGDFSYINESLNTDLDYDVVQALLFGNSADFLNDSIKMKGGKDKNNCLYFLSTIRKRKLNKMLEGSIPAESAQTIWISPVNWKITMLEFTDTETRRKFNACFEDFQVVANQLMPFHFLYNISAEKTIKADIKWSKVSINEPILFPYKVNSSYPEIKMKSQNSNGEKQGK